METRRSAQLKQAPPESSDCDVSLTQNRSALPSGSVGHGLATGDDAPSESIYPGAAFFRWHTPAFDVPNTTENQKPKFLTKADADDYGNSEATNSNGFTNTHASDSMDNTTAFTQPLTPDDIRELLFHDAVSALPFAYRRVAMDIENDDVDEVEAAIGEYVLMFMRAIESQEAHKVQARTSTRINTAGENDRWDEWQEEGQTELNGILELPDIRADLEAREWLLVQEIIDTHRLGYRLQSRPVDDASPCTKRIEDALWHLQLYSHVRKDAMDQMDFSAFASSPFEYTLSKIKNMWGNYSRAQRNSAAKKKTSEGASRDIPQDFGRLILPTASGEKQPAELDTSLKSSRPNKRARNESVAQDGAIAQHDNIQPKKKAKTQRPGAAAQRKRLAINNLQDDEYSAAPFFMAGEGDTVDDAVSTLDASAFVSSLNPNDDTALTAPSI